MPLITCNVIMWLLFDWIHRKGQSSPILWIVLQDRMALIGAANGSASVHISLQKGEKLNPTRKKLKTINPIDKSPIDKSD